MVVAVLFSAGLQVPVYPFSDVVGKGDKAVPVHMGGTGVNAGVVFGVMVMVMLAVVAHCPVFGVKV